jgi:hypothetical protein
MLRFAAPAVAVSCAAVLAGVALAGNVHTLGEQVATGGLKHLKAFGQFVTLVWHG